MKEKYFLGLDVGTSSIKTAVIDSNAKILGITSGTYRLIEEKPGYQQVDSADLWKAFLRCLEEMKNSRQVDLSKIAGIGISTLCPGLAALDKEGNVLVEPIIYSDQRSIAEAEEIKEKAGVDRLFEITANNVMAGAMSGTSMLWIKKHLPEKYARTFCFGHINTLMAVKMTDKFAIDYSNASYTSLFETAGGYQWSEELCSKIGIDKAKLPPLLRSHDIVGELNAEELIKMGIPKGTPVVIGGGDTACASLATGVVRDGDVCESVGTTNVLTICVTKPKFDRGFINRCHVVDGAWIYQGALSHTGASLGWCKDEFCQDLVLRAKQENANPYDLMTAAADTNSVPGANGIVFLPYMQGERSPIWDSYARGVFFGMSLTSKRDDFIRAILEGCGYGLRQLAELAEKVTGDEIKEFKSIGGGAKSDVWAQLKADITGKNIISLDVNDMAPIGAALLAGIGTGAFKDAIDASEKVEKLIYKKFFSNHENDEVYERRFQIYMNLYPRLKDLYKMNT